MLFNCRGCREVIPLTGCTEEGVEIGAADCNYGRLLYRASKTEEFRAKRTQLHAILSSCIVTTAYRVLKLQMEEMFLRYEG
jgi:hypothetical protein